MVTGYSVRQIIESVKKESKVNFKVIEDKRRKRRPININC